MASTHTIHPTIATMLADLHTAERTAFEATAQRTRVFVKVRLSYSLAR